MPPVARDQPADATPQPSGQPELTETPAALPATDSFVVSDRFRTNRFHFSPAQRVGCTRLLRVAAEDRYGTHRGYLGKVIPQASLPAFLRAEGAALRVLNTAPHPNLPRVRCCIEPRTAQDPSCLVFPALSGGDLHTFVRANSKASRDGRGLQEDLARNLFRQITGAVAHCHGHGVVLRDIKLGKIFFADATRTKIVIADLDGAEVLSGHTPLLKDQKGSPAYVSPEVLICRPYDGAAADVWALGVVLYMLLTGTYPFQDNMPARLFDKIQHAWRAVKFPPTMPASARALIKLLLAKQPEHRPTAEELLAHPWVTGRACASDPAPSASCTPCGDDQLVPDVASPNLGRKRGSPVDLEPLVIPKATEPRCSPSASPLVSPMSTGAMLHKMWQPASISVGADAPQGVSAKRRRGSVGDIEQAFALKAAQIPKMNEWATVSSQPPSPIAPLDGLAPSLVVS